MLSHQERHQLTKSAPDSAAGVVLAMLVAAALLTALAYAVGHSFGLI